MHKVEHRSGELADWVRGFLWRFGVFVVICVVAKSVVSLGLVLTAGQEPYVA